MLRHSGQVVHATLRCLNTVEDLCLVSCEITLLCVLPDWHKTEAPTIVSDYSLFLSEEKRKEEKAIPKQSIWQAC